MKQAFVLVAIFALIITACAPQATPTPTRPPATTAPEVTAEATEAAVEATEEATQEAAAEATEAAVEATEEATAEATEAALEATEEATEAVAAPTIEPTTVALAEATPEATEEAMLEATEEATAEATAEETAAAAAAGGIKTKWTCPDDFAGQTLSVYNWTTYVAEDTISNFEELCGVSVTYDTFSSAEAALSRLRQGNPGYDIVVPTDYTIYPMVAENLLEPLDMSKIPNFANVSEDLKNPPHDPGNQYTIPYQWGTIGIGYDRNKTGEDITTWAQVFAYDGPVAWLEDPRSMLGVALSILGFDPNSDNPDEINQAKEFLIENGKNVTYIAGDDGQELLARGEVDIAVEYSGDIFQIMAQCAEDSNCTADFQYAIPAEAANIWTDVLVIPVGAQNIPLAHAFIDYILDPQVGADISNYTAYATPNQAAIDQGLIAEDLLNNPAIYPSDEVREHLFFIVAQPDAEQTYNDAWDEIKIALGR